MRVINLNVHTDRLHFIDNSHVDDFIVFAKNYNIFQESNSKVFDEVCEKIKARLDREGLPYDTVRPE